MTAIDIDGLTAEWLSATLVRDVRSVTTERIGTGQTGAAYRVTYESDDGAASLIAKVAAGDEAARRRVRSGYRTEVGFYEHLAPSVEARIPRCDFAAISEDGLVFTLLLEDLAPRSPGSQAEGCSRDRAQGAIDNLAALHAPRWSDPALLDLDFASGPTPELASLLGSLTISAVETFVGWYEADLGPADVETLRQAAAAIGSWVMSRTDVHAIVHGDYRLDNLMLGADPDDVVAVDWQTLAIGPPTRDVAYFLGTCVEPTTRRASEHALVQRYHAQLIDRGVTGYSAERCYEDYRLGVLQAPMITMLGAVHATAERSEQADAMFLAMARRASAAIGDLRPFDLL